MSSLRLVKCFLMSSLMSFSATLSWGWHGECSQLLFLSLLRRASRAILHWNPYPEGRMSNRWLSAQAGLYFALFPALVLGQPVLMSNSPDITHDFRPGDRILHPVWNHVSPVISWTYNYLVRFCAECFLNLTACSFARGLVRRPRTPKGTSHV